MARERDYKADYRPKRYRGGGRARHKRDTFSFWFQLGEPGSKNEPDEGADHGVPPKPPGSPGAPPAPPKPNAPPSPHAPPKSEPVAPEPNSLVHVPKKDETKREEEDLKKDRKGKRRIVRDDRQLRRVIMREIHKNQALLKDISRAIADLSKIKSSPDSRVERSLHDLKRIEQEIKAFLRLRKREQRVEEREHNHYLQLLSRLEHQIREGEERELLEHEQRAHRALYTRFTELTNRLREAHDQLAEHESSLERHVRQGEKALQRIGYEQKKEQVPDQGSITLIGRLIEELERIRELLAHAVELEEQLAQLERQGMQIEKREMREDKSELKQLKALPAQAGPAGAIPAPDGSLEHLMRATATAKTHLDHLIERVHWLSGHFKLIEGLSNQSRMSEDMLHRIGQEPRAFREIEEQVRHEVDSFHGSVTHIAEDDSKLMDVVKRTTFATGGLLGNIKKLEDHAEHPVDPAEYEAIKKAIHARVDRIHTSTQNLHRFVNWLEDSDGKLLNGLVQMVQQASQLLGSWYESYGKHMEGRLSQKALAALGRGADEYRKVFEEFDRKLKVISDGLVEYEKVQRAEEKVLAEDTRFFNRLGAAKTMSERLSVLRST